MELKRDVKDVTIQMVVKTVRLDELYLGDYVV